MTTVNFEKNGKKVSKVFRSYSAVVKFFQTEIEKINVKEKALNRNQHELRANLETEKNDYEKIATLFKNLISARKTVRNDKTGDYIEIEYR